MNWYAKHEKIVRIAELRGEWWIIDGSADFADGDVGDYNHDAIAIEHAQSIVRDAMEKDPVIAEAAYLIFGEQGDYDSYDPIATREALNNWSDDMLSQGKLTDEEVDDIYQTIVNRTGVDPEILRIAMGLVETGAARDYAIKFWKWKRVAGNAIETYTLTPADAKDIANGLWSAYGEEAENETYTIYVYSTKKFYTDVTFEDIEKGPMAINRRRTAKTDRKIRKQADYDDYLKWKKENESEQPEANLENVPVFKRPSKAEQIKRQVEDAGGRIFSENKGGGIVKFTIAIMEEDRKKFRGSLEDKLIFYVAEELGSTYGSIRKNFTISSKTLYPEKIMNNIRSRKRTWQQLTQEERNQGIFMIEMFVDIGRAAKMN